MSTTYTVRLSDSKERRAASFIPADENRLPSRHNALVLTTRWEAVLVALSAKFKCDAGHVGFAGFDTVEVIEVTVNERVLSASECRTELDAATKTWLEGT